MEIWQLKTFCVVARTLHFTRASEELGLTQSAVSHQIKSLEKDLGVKLFERNRRHISLTPQGKIVLEYADRMLDQIDEMKGEIKENKNKLEGELKLVGMPRSLDNPFPQVREEFRKIYKDIKVTFQSVLDTEDVLSQVRRGDADVGFTTKNMFDLFNYEGLLTIPWVVFEMMTVVGKDHSLARQKKKISLKDLEQEEWVLFEKGSWLRYEADNIFSQHNFAPKNIYESNDGAIIRSMAKRGEGIALFPEWGILDDLKSGSLVKLIFENIGLEVAVSITISSTRHSKLVNAFVDFLQNTQLEGLHLKGQTQTTSRNREL